LLYVCFCQQFKCRCEKFVAKNDISCSDTIAGENRDVYREMTQVTRLGKREPKGCISPLIKERNSTSLGKLGIPRGNNKSDLTGEKHWKGIPESIEGKDPISTGEAIVSLGNRLFTVIQVIAYKGESKRHGIICYPR
jgi:hypothetical protein